MKDDLCKCIFLNVYESMQYAKDYNNRPLFLIKWSSLKERKKQIFAERRSCATC